MSCFLPQHLTCSGSRWTFAREDSFNDEMIIPPFLMPGDRVGIVATARWIDREPLDLTRQMLSDRGLEAVISDNLFSRNFQLAGSDHERAAALQKMLDNSTIKAILIARGGYGTIRLLEYLDWSKFLKNPKWICGYSDITVLHGVLDRLRVASIHSTMPVSFPVASSEAIECLFNSLSGTGHKLEWQDEHNRTDISVRGKVKGGNLSVLYSLCGSGDMPEMNDAIVFLEDVDEHYYHIDRMMMGLWRAGFFKGAKAILLGGLTQMKDNTIEFGFPFDNPWGADGFQIIESIANKLDIPFVAGFPAGHMNDNRAFYMGMSATLKVEGGRCSLTYDT